MIYKNIPSKYLELCKTRYQEYRIRKPSWYNSFDLILIEKHLNKKRIPCRIITSLFLWRESPEGYNAWHEASLGNFSLLARYEEL